MLKSANQDATRPAQRIRELVQATNARAPHDRPVDPGLRFMQRLKLIHRG